jgi:hypothetical protein
LWSRGISGWTIDSEIERTETLQGFDTFWILKGNHELRIGSCSIFGGLPIRIRKCCGLDLNPGGGAVGNAARSHEVIYLYHMAEIIIRDVDARLRNTFKAWCVEKGSTMKAELIKYEVSCLQCCDYTLGIPWCEIGLSDRLQDGVDTQCIDDRSGPRVLGNAFPVPTVNDRHGSAPNTLAGAPSVSVAFGGRVVELRVPDSAPSVQ